MLNTWSQAAHATLINQLGLNSYNVNDVYFNLVIIIISFKYVVFPLPTMQILTNLTLTD